MHQRITTRRYSIRKHRHRGKDGWLLHHIFFEHYAAACKVREELRADPYYQVTLEDFAITDGVYAQAPKWRPTWRREDLAPALAAWLAQDHQRQVQGPHGLIASQGNLDYDRWRWMLAAVRGR